jgi:hypothetical protein
MSERFSKEITCSATLSACEKSQKWLISLAFLRNLTAKKVHRNVWHSNHSSLILLLGVAQGSISWMAQSKWALSPWSILVMCNPTQSVSNTSTVWHLLLALLPGRGRT